MPRRTRRKRRSGLSVSWTRCVRTFSWSYITSRFVKETADIKPQLEEGEPEAKRSKSSSGKSSIFQLSTFRAATVAVVSKGNTRTSSRPGDLSWRSKSMAQSTSSGSSSPLNRALKSKWRIPSRCCITFPGCALAAAAQAGCNAFDDLTEDLLDLLEDTAFPQTPDEDETSQQEEEMMGPKLMTNKKLTRYLHDREQELFAGLEHDKKSGMIGPTYQPWELIYIIVQIFANLSSVPENPKWYMENPRILDVIMRVCMLAPGLDYPTPRSKFLKLHQLLRVRKDALSLIGNTGPELDLSRNPPRTIKRLHSLLIAAIMAATRRRSKLRSTQSRCSPAHTHARR